MSKKSPPEILYAQDVIEVYKNLGSLPGSRNWSSPSASHLFDWVRQDGNEVKFLSVMVQKAADLLAKHGQTDTLDAIRAIDTKTISELRACLSTALQASQEGEFVELESEQAPEPETAVLTPPVYQVEKPEGMDLVFGPVLTESDLRMEDTEIFEEPTLDDILG